MTPELLADYAASAADEAVEPGGRLRPGYAPLGPVLERLGRSGLAAAAAALAAERDRRGVRVTAWTDGRQVPQPFPQDPWPRVVPAGSCVVLAGGRLDDVRLGPAAVGGPLRGVATYVPNMAESATR